MAHGGSDLEIQGLESGQVFMKGSLGPDPVLGTRWPMQSTVEFLPSGGLDTGINPRPARDCYPRAKGRRD